MTAFNARSLDRFEGPSAPTAVTIREHMEKLNWLTH